MMYCTPDEDRAAMWMQMAKRQGWFERARSYLLSIFGIVTAIAGGAAYFFL